MKLRDHLKLYTWAVLLASFLIVSFTYFVAGTTYGYEVLVKTNDYGEHWIEVILILAALPGLWPLTKDLLFTPSGPTQTN